MLRRITARFEGSLSVVCCNKTMTSADAFVEHALPRLTDVPGVDEIPLDLDNHVALHD